MSELTLTHSPTRYVKGWFVVIKKAGEKEKKLPRIFHANSAAHEYRDLLMKQGGVESAVVHEAYSFE
jgi:hypothetical protein